MNTDTPRTDAVDCNEANEIVILSRQLERELTAEQEKVKRLREIIKQANKIAELTPVDNSKIAERWMAWMLVYAQDIQEVKK